MFARQDNPLIAAAKTGKRLTHPFLAPAVVWLIFFAAIIFSSVISPLMNPSTDSVFGAALIETLMLIVAFGFVTALLWLWLHFYEGRSFASLGFFAGRIGVQIVRGALVGAGLIALVTGLLVALGGYVLVTDESPNFGMSALPAVLLVLVGWIVQGSTEELVFRGWLLPVMSARTSLRVGIVVSSLLFAVLHGFNPGITILAVINLALFGLLTAFYALREGSLWGVCALHAVWNWVEGNVLGTPVSGGTSSFALWRFALASSAELLTGGAFGIEGSVVMTIVLLMAVGVVWWLAKR